MSNRNNKSKSPQTKKPIPYDKDLMKYLILQKITKPQPPVELITKTQPDEDSEVEDFKQEIEQKYKQCKANKVYQFPKEQYESSSDASLESLTDVTVYNLNSELHLTDATQPQFIKALNEKLMLLQEDTPPFKSAKQHNYAPVLKSSRRLQQNPIGQSVINRRYYLEINQFFFIFQVVKRKESHLKKIHHLNLLRRTNRSLNKYNRSQRLLKNKEKQAFIKNLKLTITMLIQVLILIIALLQQVSHLNDKIIELKLNMMNQKQTQISFKQIQNQGFLFLNLFKILNRSKLRETAKPKKMEFPQGHKILNYTMDNQLLESLCISRNAKSQNKNYKV